MDENKEIEAQEVETPLKDPLPWGWIAFFGVLFVAIIACFIVVMSL
ncbi:MAG: hypothetical protein J6328_06740 [Bacilli bacterium]|nr:hypothetical protein [Bacilli bacterium]